MEAIFLAGGLGTRLRSVVSDVPKPMAPVAGKPFLEHLLNYWIGQGITSAILSVGYRHETVQCHFGENYRGLPIQYAVEHEPRGTGGGVALASRFLKGTAPFLICNGDTFVDVSLGELKITHQKKRAPCTLTVLEVDPNTRYGAVLLGDADRVIGFAAKDAAPTRSWINAGVYLAEPSWWEAIPKPERFSIESDLFPAEAARGRLFAHRHPGRFLDIGIPEDYARAADFL